MRESGFKKNDLLLGPKYARERNYGWWSLNFHLQFLPEYLPSIISLPILYNIKASLFWTDPFDFSCFVEQIIPDKVACHFYNISDSIVCFISDIVKGNLKVVLALCHCLYRHFGSSQGNNIAVLAICFNSEVFMQCFLCPFYTFSKLYLFSSWQKIIKFTVLQRKVIWRHCLAGFQGWLTDKSQIFRGKLYIKHDKTFCLYLNYNHGYKPWDKFAFLRHFLITNAKPFLHPTVKQQWTLVFRI